MWKVIGSWVVFYYAPFFLFPFRWGLKRLYSCDVIAVWGCFVFCGVVREEIDGCFCVGGFSKYVSFDLIRLLN
jgi:hypothetical protein